jgi:hypothetical protein
MHHRGLLAGLVVLSLAVFAGSAQAKSATGARNGAIHGIVFAHGASRVRATNNLTYHGGPVMSNGNTVYAIYWVPSGFSVSASYESVINRYFSDVAADSVRGVSTNVYWSDTQYSSIPYNSTFAGPIVDTSSFPPNGCRDRYTSVCLTDAQLQAEVAKVAAQTGKTGLGYEYFVFTPKNVGSCFGSSCAYSYFCAYHSNFQASNGSQVLYANMPYAAWEPAACGSGESPNGDDADSTLNVTSHEHNETITDPLGTAWYDSSGNEDGDKCAWNFGTPLAGSPGAEYNQVINGDHYYLQQEWSNHSSGCVLQGL